MDNLLDNKLDVKKKKSATFRAFLIIESIIVFIVIFNIFNSVYSSNFFMDYVYLIIIPYLISLFIALLTFLRDKGKIRNTLFLLFILKGIWYSSSEVAI